MFIETVHKLIIDQIELVVSFDEWKNVFVGCSGSFRFDSAIRQRHWRSDLPPRTIPLFKLDSVSREVLIWS